MFLKNGSVQVTHLVGSLRRMKVRQAVTAPPGETPEELAGVLAGNRIPRKQVTVALPAHLVTCRKTTLPLTAASQIQKTIKFHAEKIIPGVTPDEVVVDYLVTAREAGFTELLLVVVRQQVLADYLKRFEQLDVTGVTVDFAVLFNLLYNFRMFKGAELCAVADFSGDAVTILLVRQEKLQFVRTLPALPKENPGRALRDALNYARISADAPPPVNRLILTGKVPEDVTIDGFAGEEEIEEVITFDPAKHVHLNRKAVDPALLRTMPVASGAALENLGTTQIPINFKKEAYQYRSTYERIRTPCFLIAVLLVAAVAVSLLVTMNEKTAARNYLGSLNVQAKGLFNRVAKGSRAKFTGTFDKTLASLVKKLTIDNAGDKTWDSFIDFLALFCLHATAGEEAVIQSISFDGKKAVIRGEARSVDSFEQLAKGLEESGKFSVRTPFRIRSGRRNQPARLAFTIELSPRRES